MRVLQINMDRRRVAVDLAFQTAAAREVDFVIVAEPNKTALRRSGTWYRDNKEDCCVIRINHAVPVNEWGKGDGFVWIRVGSTVIYSVYISPNVEEEEYQAFLEALRVSTLSKGAKIIVGGDFNAKSPLWGSVTEDQRGGMVADWAMGMGLVPVNRGDKPTFQRGNSKSIIDITWATEVICGSVTGWEVLDEESGSLHRYIYFEAEDGGGTHTPQRRRAKLRMESMKEEVTGADYPEVRDVKSLMRQLKRTQDAATTWVPIPHGGGDAYWWTEEIADLRAEALRKRRTYTRACGRATREDDALELLRGDYRAARRALRKAIVKSREERWKTLQGEIENDVWGEGYKIVTRSLKIQAPVIDLEKDDRARFASELFPVAERVVWEEYANGTAWPHSRITPEEVRNAAGRIKINRAPGPDGILPETTRAFAIAQGERIAGILDELMRAGSFPAEWKKAKLVLVPKPGKDLSVASGFRPICLLDTMGKLFEAVILKRLQDELEERAPLHLRQYGFRKGRSTIDAARDVLGTVRHAGANSLRALVLLDVRNAFNSATWRGISSALESRGISPGLIRIIRDYLRDRKLEIYRGSSREVNMGVPQGSILGPTLWNVLYDGVLEVECPEGTKLVAYADDLALVADDSKEEGLQNKVNGVLAEVDRWMEENGLELAPAKTEVVIFSMRRLRNLRLRLRDVDLPPGKEVRYLGVTFDRHLNFGAHITRACHKADKTAGAILKLMPNIRGPSQSKRRILAQVVYSIVLYAAPIWYTGLGMKKYRDMVIGVQRRVAIRTISAYRTVSAEAALVIAGQVPLDLLAQERKTIFEAGVPLTPRRRREIRAESLRRWQERFSAAENGRWTASLITDLGRWCGRSFGETEYYATQFLTGHGCFGNYLFRIGKRDTDCCDLCGQPDSAEHTVFRCEAHEERRAEIQRDLGFSLTTGNVIEAALESKRNWETIFRGIRDIVRRKEGRVLDEEPNP